MAKKRKRDNIKDFLIPVLRNASRIWWAKKEARKRAKRKVQDGFYKNGKPKYIIKYECCSCHELFDMGDTQMDHVLPAIDPDAGFIDWNTYIARLFPDPEGYQCLCKDKCHREKTNQENKERRKCRFNKK